MNLLGTDVTEHVEQQKDEINSCASIQKDWRMDQTTGMETREISDWYQKSLTWAAGSFSRDHACGMISSTSNHQAQNWTDKKVGCLRLLLMRKGSCIALIQESFSKCGEDELSSSKPSQSPTADSSKEAIRLARKFEDTGKRHSRADISSRNSSTIKSFQETCIQLLEQILRSLHNITPSHFSFSCTTRT